MNATPHPEPAPVPPPMHLAPITLKGTTTGVPAYAIHRDFDSGVLGYVLRERNTTKWAAMHASAGPKFTTSYGHPTRAAAVAHVLETTRGTR